MDKVLLASRGVEWLLGRFNRLRTPLGLVMRQLSADRDRERLYPPIPPCSQRLCRIRQACAHRLPRWLLRLSFRPIHPFTSPPSLLPSVRRSNSVSLWASLRLSLQLCPSPSVSGFLPLAALALPAQSPLPTPRWVISDHVGGCLTRYTRNTL